MALDEGRSGMLSGAGAGAMFGPVGIFAGAVLGGLFGRSAKKRRRREEARILKANTKQAYGIGEREFEDLTRSRKTAEAGYQYGLASAKAKYGAAGARLEGESWLALLGEEAAKRDRSLGDVQLREDEFRTSEAYKFLKQDYDFMSGMQSQQDPWDDTDSRTYSLVKEGKSGESFFTENQQSDLRDYSGISQSSEGWTPQGFDRSDKAAYESYRSSVMPTIEEYEQSRFGGDEERAGFESVMTQRINDANRIYDEYLLQRNVAIEQQRQDYRNYG